MADPTHTHCFYAPPQDWARYVGAAKKDGRTLSNWIRRACAEKLDRDAHHNTMEPGPGGKMGVSYKR